jgi:3-hydroxyisobutyrate dehydrogenase
MRQRIGFVGVGNMGKLMAAHLLKAHHSVTVYDLDPTPLEELRELGAEVATSAAECAANAQVVITMLPSSPHVEAAVLGPDGILEGLPAGATLIDMSTIDPLVSRRVNQEVTARGFGMLDAPVSGGTVGARDATLAIMVGGPRDLFDACCPILELLGKNVIYCGEAGMGAVVKVVNNLIAGVTLAAVAEAFNIGVRAGADPRLLHNVVTRSSGNCWALHTIPPYPGLVNGAPADRDFAPGFMIDLMHKDLGLAMSAAKGLGAPSFLASTAHELFGVASNLGHGRHDQSAVVKAIEALSRPVEAPVARALTPGDA